MKRCPKCNTPENNIQFIEDNFLCFNCNAEDSIDKIVEDGIEVRRATNKEVEEFILYRESPFQKTCLLIERLWDKIDTTCGTEFNIDEVFVQGHQHHKYLDIMVYDIWIKNKFIGSISL